MRSEAHGSSRCGAISGKQRWNVTVEQGNSFTCWVDEWGWNFYGSNGELWDINQLRNFPDSQESPTLVKIGVGRWLVYHLYHPLAVKGVDKPLYYSTNQWEKDIGGTMWLVYGWWMAGLWLVNGWIMDFVARCWFHERSVIVDSFWPILISES